MYILNKLMNNIINELMNKWINKQINETNKWMVSWINERMNEWTNDEWINGLPQRQKRTFCKALLFSPHTQILITFSF